MTVHNDSQDRDLTALSDPRAIPTRQIYKPRYSPRAEALLALRGITLRLLH